MKEEIKNIGGLIALPEDSKDYSFTKAFGAIDLSEIPDDFVIGEFRQENQGNTDFCTAFSTTSASELQEGLELNPFWSFAVSKMISGNPRIWGQDLRTAMKVHTRYGAIKEEEFDWGKMDNNNLRFIENYPEDLFEKAKAHKKLSYFKIDGYGSTFDALRATLWNKKANKQAIITGTVIQDVWLSAPDGIIKEEGNPMMGDAFILIGQKTIDGQSYLIAQLSAGKNIGDNGKLYFSRDIVNKFFTFGAFCFVDLDPREAKKLAWSWLRRFWEKCKKIIKGYFEIMFS